MSTLLYSACTSSFADQEFDHIDQRIPILQIPPASHPILQYRQVHFCFLSHHMRRRLMASFIHGSALLYFDYALTFADEGVHMLL